MAKLIHAMVRVLDEARSVDFYDKAFGLKIADRYDFESFTLVYLSNPESDMEVELVLNKDRTEPYTHGDGYGHVAFSVDDLDGHNTQIENLLEEVGYVLLGDLLLFDFHLPLKDGLNIQSRHNTGFE